jgi:hypothetical protein
MGYFAILITVLAFIAGGLRNELVLTLLGTVFLGILAYCFLGVFLLGILHRRKARALSIALASEIVPVGGTGEFCVKTEGRSVASRMRFWRLPAILIRCELNLQTRDGRVIRCYSDPAAQNNTGRGIEGYSRFPVNERGAYYAMLRPRNCDKFTIFDAPGFFRVSLRIAQQENARLLAIPHPAEELIPLSLKAGGTERRNEAHYRKSDEFTDHRPYIPGDDPRRINWKLYSHAPLGELFVREGEPEPPPHSRLLILIDSEADRTLYTLDEARRAVDLLCENALTAALELSGQGMDILIGYAGGKIIGAKDESGPLNVGELAAALAWPAAMRWPSEQHTHTQGEPAGDFPRTPGDRAVLILALPRASAEPSALDRFLKGREAGQGTDILFLYDGTGKRAAELEDSARVCVNLYNGRAGVHAGKIVLLHNHITKGAR